MVSLARFIPALILVPYFVMIACGLMMPSDGYHGLKSPKSLSFLATSYTVLLYFFYRNRFTPYQWRLLGFTLGTLSFFLLWLLIGLIRHEEGFAAPLDQFKIFTITLIFTVTTLYIVSEKLIRPEAILKGMIFTNLAYSLLKIVGMTLHFMGTVKLLDIMEKLGIRVMSMHLGEGLSRFQTSVDIITPFLVYFVLQSKPLNLNFSRTFKALFCLISLLSILLSFSRFLLAVGFLSAFFYWMTLTLPRLAKGVLLFALIIAAGVSSIGLDETYKLIHKRFLSVDNFKSDQVRVEQTEALLEEYDRYPLLGKGIGGTAHKYLRDGELTHSYEVQWVSFLMQFGIVGILLLLLPPLYMATRFLTRPLTRIKIGFLLLFILWLLSGFTNPYLISLTSGIVYAAFLLAAMILQNPIQKIGHGHEVKTITEIM